MVLQNDDVKQIALELTVPFACEERFCMLFVHSYIPEKVTNDVCSINTISQTVEEGTGYACTVGFEKGPDIQHRNISIRGKVGGKAASAGPIEYAVFLRISSTTHPFMNNSIVGPIRVGRICLFYFQSVIRVVMWCFKNMYWQSIGNHKT